LPRAEKPPAQQPTAPTRPRYLRRWIAALAAAGILIVAGGLWWLWQSPKGPLASATAPPLEKVVAPAVPRLSIVVLPFVNLSDDPKQQYFVDGVTDNLTTDLSRIGGSFVISRNTAFTYKDKPVNAKQIGRELGVRYVLEGSVQRSGNHVRVNTQLIDAETDAHVWADRFDRDVGDLFALQNEITKRIAVALNIALARTEAARPTANPDALDYIFRGRAAMYNKHTRDNYAEQVSIFEHALALDPRSAEAQAQLAESLVARTLDRMTDTADADIARAEDLVGQTLAASPNNPTAHFVQGQILRARGQCKEAIPEYETALAANPNSAFTISAIGRCKILIGLIDEGIPLLEQAILLSPGDANLATGIYGLGKRICCCRAQTRRSSGSRRRAASLDLRHRITLTSTSRPPMPSTARPNAPPPNSPRPRNSGNCMDSFISASLT
jgi:adenylate cyclase